MVMALTLLSISMLVVLHELGHLLVARACGMRVLRFSVGFGPILLSRRVGEISWQLAAIPMGGFVEIDGMATGEAQPAAEPNSPPGQPVSADPRLFNSKPIWQRFAVILAGPATNWLTCAGLLVGLAATCGLMQLDLAEARIGEVAAGGPAAAAGLQAGDRIEAVNQVPLTDWSSLVQAVRPHPQEKIALRVERQGQILELQVQPQRGPGNLGLLQVQPYATRTTYSLADSLSAGIHGAWELTLLQGQLLGGMFTGHGQGRLTGLPGIVKTVSQQAKQAPSRLFEQLAMLSIGLCLLNLLPIPALDGSRLLFLLIEWIRRRPVDARIEGVLHTAGFVLLLGVMVWVSVRDML
jgi:regulator of sigma E protease